MFTVTVNASVTNIIIWRFREAIPGVHNRIFALLSALDAEKSDSKKAKDGGKLSENHNLPTNRTMQDALQQVVREKDAALREKDAENALSKMAKLWFLSHLAMLAG